MKSIMALIATIVMCTSALALQPHFLWEQPATTSFGLNQTVNSEWNDGKCLHAVVTNTGTIKADWQVSFSLNGTIMSAWDSWYEHENGTATFTPALWNSQLSPGQSTSFGYCVSEN